MADQTTIDNLYNELLKQYNTINSVNPSLASQIYGGGAYTSDKKGLGSYEAVFKDMAKELADKGVTALSDIKQEDVPVMERVKVTKQYTNDYNPEWTGSYVDDRGNVYSADQVKQADWTGTGDAGTTTENVVEVPTGQTQKVPVNSLTGDTLFNTSWDQNNQEVFNPYFARTYAGEDGTAYSINFTDQGQPVISSQGFDTSDNDALRYLAMFAALVVPNMLLDPTIAVTGPSVNQAMAMEGAALDFAGAASAFPTSASATAALQAAAAGGGVAGSVAAAKALGGASGLNPAATAGLSSATLANLAKAGLGLFTATQGMPTVTSAGQYIPANSMPIPTADYYQQMQDAYNKLGVGNVTYPGAASGDYSQWYVTPQNIATPLESWYQSGMLNSGNASLSDILDTTTTPKAMVTPELDTRAGVATTYDPSFVDVANQNAAYYNELMNAGWTDAQIREAAAQQFGPVTDATWGMLTGVASGTPASTYVTQPTQAVTTPTQPLVLDTTQAQVAATTDPGYQAAVNQNVAYYNQLMGQGYNDAQIRAAAEQQYGPISNAVWQTLTSQVG